LYDDEEKGIITAGDLADGLGSVEIYDGKDKKSLECFTIYCLRLNQKSTQWIKISDVIKTLYPSGDNSIRKKKTNGVAKQ
jgi:hypothetical protein